MADENNEDQENAETQEQPNGAEVSDVEELKEGQ